MSGWAGYKGYRHWILFDEEPPIRIYHMDNSTDERPLPIRLCNGSDLIMNYTGCCLVGIL